MYGTPDLDTRFGRFRALLSALLAIPVGIGALYESSVSVSNLFSPLILLVFLFGGIVGTYYTSLETKSDARSRLEEAVAQLILISLVSAVVITFMNPSLSLVYPSVLIVGFGTFNALFILNCILD